MRARVVSIFFHVHENGSCSTSRVILLPSKPDALELIISHEAVDEVIVENERPLTILVRHTCPLADVFAAAAHPSPPFTVQAGRAEWDHAGDGEELRRMLRDRGLRITVRRVRRGRGRELTPRQREILLRAIEEGYYDFPRRITLSELADKLGISKSYLSETLAKVESKLLPEILILHG